MLRIYQRFWHVNWAQTWQYRANLAMYLLYWIVSPVVYLAVWITIANSQGSVQGLTANDFITYYMTLLIVDQLTSDITIHIIAYRIQDGSLSNELLRPVHPILTDALMNNLSFKTLTFITLIPVWSLLFLLFKPNFSSVTLGSIALAIPAVLLGFATAFMMGACITSLAFWTTRVYSVDGFFNMIGILFSGQFVPLSLMPPVIQSIAQFLPYQMLKYVPIQIILNKLSMAEILRDYVVGVVWFVLLALLFRWVWRQGLKHYSAVGA